MRILNSNRTLFLSLSAFFFANVSYSQALLDPLSQPKFVNSLPIPSVIDGKGGGTLHVTAKQFEHSMGIIDPVTKLALKTKVWGYEGTFPGPTILAKKNTALDVYWHNGLKDVSNNPIQHFLPVDKTLHWAYSSGIASLETDGVPLVTHLHGGHTESASDGLPMAWVTPNGKTGEDFIKGGDVSPYHYTNDQEAATLWYHDHAMGLTRLNVYAGLAGFYLLSDENEQALKSANKLPADPYDIGLVIQDRMFTADGQLHYPSTLVPAAGAPIPPTPSALPEFYGDFILVNGKTWPKLEVEPRQYRFRLLNGSDSRFYNMSLSNGQVFYEIGSDNGFLPSPLKANSILLAPGERKDIVIDFTKDLGQTIILNNNAKSPFPSGTIVNPKTSGQVMAFVVNKPINTGIAQTTLPASLRPSITPLTTNIPPRQVILYEATDSYGRLMPSLGTVSNGVMAYMDAATEMPQLNTTEIWEVFNETMDAHPIHLHAVTMQMINRQKFTATVDPITGKPTNIKLKGLPTAPLPDEKGWKDTWVMYPGEVTRVIAKFDLEGMYVWHCHILSHEDNEMMRPLHIMNGPMRSSNSGGAAMLTPQMMEQQIGLKLTPNPFSNIVTVRFTTDMLATIGLELYDLKGSLIKNVFQGVRPAGPHQFEIDGTQLSNGTYFSVITVDGVKMVRKLVLQK
jgi:spore coat protein A